MWQLHTRLVVGFGEIIMSKTVMVVPAFMEFIGFNKEAYISLIITQENEITNITVLGGFIVSMS